MSTMMPRAPGGNSRPDIMTGAKARHQKRTESELAPFTSPGGLLAAARAHLRVLLALTIWHISIFSSIKVSALWLSAQPVAHRLENKGSKPSLET